MNEYNPIPSSTNTKKDIYKDIVKSKRSSTSRFFFKTLILILILIFIFLIFYFLLVETMADPSIKSKSVNLFKSITDSSFDYISKYSNLIRNESVAECFSSKNKEIIEFYLKSSPCLHSNSINSTNSTLFSDYLKNVISSHSKRLKTTSDEIIEKTKKESQVEKKEERKRENHVLNGNVNFEVILNENYFLSKIKLDEVSSLEQNLFEFLFKSNSVHGIWLNNHINPILNHEIYIEDRVLYILDLYNKDHNTYKFDDVYVEVSISHMIYYDKNDLVNGYSNVKGDYIDSYEYDSESNEEENIDEKLFLKFHNVIEPIFSIQNTTTIPSSSIKFRLKKGDFIYIPSFHSVQITFNQSVVVDLLNISFLSRSRFLSTLIQTMFNNII